MEKDQPNQALWPMLSRRVGLKLRFHVLLTKNIESPNAKRDAY